MCASFGASLVRAPNAVPNLILTRYSVGRVKWSHRCSERACVTEASSFGVSSSSRNVNAAARSGRQAGAACTVKGKAHQGLLLDRSSIAARRLPRARAEQ